jgi:wyosine [tRNA(Phe)-imidazoG37] synthetase (radical SAM superfamily)
MKIFGPVPSRRLGQSLGINNIKAKTCSYACVYCQLGVTRQLQVKRETFYDLNNLLEQLDDSLKELEQKSEKIDYITFVADGEPTLDLNLGKALKEIKKFDIKTAVISNASLITEKQVREELKFADWVSLKVDAVSENIWKKIDRPHGSLNLAKIKNGIEIFSREYTGQFVTETMLVKGINDQKNELEKIADFIKKLGTSHSYIAVPTRPPAEKFVQKADPEKINLAYQIFKLRNIKTEYLIGYEGNKFSSTGNLENDLLNITAVHPLKEEAVSELIKKTDSDWKTVEELIRANKIIVSEYNGEKYYLRK